MQNDVTGRADEDDDSVVWAAISNEERDGLNVALAITTLRCQQASRPEDRIWQASRNQTGSA